MKTAARIFSILALVVLLLAATGAWADSHVRIVRLSYLQGDVSMDLGQGAGSERAVLNMPILEGARIWTGVDGQAEVEFEDGSTVRIAPNTTLAFTTLSLRDSGGRVNALAVSGGTTYVDVPKLEKQDEYIFQLPNRSIALNHSVHFRIDMDGMEARIAVFKGQLDVAGPERSVDIRKGETLTLSLSDPGRYNLANTVASLAFDAWDQDRDDTIREAFVNRNNPSYPYGYGYADLMNYGSFMNVAGYGSCWRPYGVGFNWDPFDFGYWSYYPGFGYTWVSGYPWGWAPYRYGGWAWMDGSGWSWCPRYNNVNNYWYSWNVVPVVINAPPRWHPPHPPAKPSVGLPPIVPVGHRGPTPYRTGVVDGPGSGTGANPAADSGNGDRHGGRRGADRDTGSHFSGNGGTPSGGNGGTPSGGTGGTPVGGPVIVIPPSPADNPSPAGDRDRARGPRPSRGIDLTAPGNGPSGRGPQSGPQNNGPIESPVRVMRSPGIGPGDRMPHGDAGNVSRGESSRSSAPAPAPHVSSPQPSAPAPMPHIESPRSTAPAPSAPSSGSPRSKPPV